MGAETRIVWIIGRINDGGSNIGPREEVGGGDRATNGEGVSVETGVVISIISVIISVWVETDV